MKDKFNRSDFYYLWLAFPKEMLHG